MSMEHAGYVKTESDELV